MSDFYTKEWDKSFKRLENNILYPKEGIVKFLNRYIRKKISYNNEHIDILNPKIENQNLRGLDFGCGNGRQTILLEEFNIEGYGCDISNEAIKIAKKNADIFNKPNLKDRLLKLNGKKLPFKNNFFNFCISDSCLDSMYFDLAKQCIEEIGRVTKNYIYLSLIGKNDSDLTLNDNYESRVTEMHEFGTIQSYFDIKKINQLISIIDFDVISLRKISEKDVTDNKFNTRYFIILKNKKD